ncbi:MAG: histidine kinase, partial [Bacteroidetes bacterium]|nr:histidine kinase [Bacteroidota bacterium]
MNRSTLYWLLQVLGWGSFAFVNVFFASLSKGISPLQTWAFLALAAFYLLSTHAFRLLIKYYNSFRLEIFRLITLVLLAVGFLAVSNVLAQVLI